MGKNSSDELHELLEAQVRLEIQAFSYMKSMSLKCAVELGIPDTIHKHGQPMTVRELVDALAINPSKASSIYRLMRVLVHYGFFSRQKLDEKEEEEKEEEEEGGYWLTPASRLLLKDEPLNSRAMFLLQTDPMALKSWKSLSSWFRNEDPTPFQTAHGGPTWEYVGEKPRVNDLVNEAMACDSRLVAKALVDECKHVFEGLSSLVDVGGGTGALARVIAETFPDLKCTVFDFPYVIADSKGTKNLDFVGGNLLETVPSANAILLKWILHIWGDEECLNILKKCKAAVPSKKDGGKVIIIDMIRENEKKDDPFVDIQHFMDMQMMIFNGSKERSKKEWEKLIFDAGYSDYKITSINYLRSVIELYP